MSDTKSATGELTFTRIFDAPRELVFRCMIEPEHLSHFWGPIGTSAPVEKITIDPRPGGVFEATTSLEAFFPVSAPHRPRSAFFLRNDPTAGIHIPSGQRMMIVTASSGSAVSSPKESM